MRLHIPYCNRATRGGRALAQEAGQGLARSDAFIRDVVARMFKCSI